MATHCNLSWVCRSRFVFRFWLLVGAFTLSPAFGADAPQEGALEEIVVTATKREESLQTIPISVTAFSSDMIERLDFAVSYDIAAQVPNLQFMAESSPSTTCSAMAKWPIHPSRSREPPPSGP